MGSSEIAHTCWTAQQASSSSFQRVYEIPFQIHIVAHGWPGGNDLCPLLMQLAVLRGEKRDRKWWAVCPFYALNMKSWTQGTCTANALQNTRQLPSGCCTDPGLQGTTTSCLLEGDRRQTLLTPLHHCYSTHKISHLLGPFNRRCSQATNPADASRLLC